MKTTRINWLFIVFAIMVSYTDIRTAASIMCYECTIAPRYNQTVRLCSHFNESQHYQVNCPNSTFCTKKITQLTLQGGKTVTIEEKGCAQQIYKYQVFEQGKWVAHWAIDKNVYQDGCFPTKTVGLKVSNATVCYCSSDLCNSAKTTTEASFFHHTDTMAVIFIFNVVRFLRSSQ